ncbi:HD-GYP domain-containing protein [Clostridium arbusti]|uniref:HD-GYP domain-containing protein n=1 Tax=Clostridium arbusti TaxID=1137848 RepID=UPI00028A2052|nr:HD domain-containing phosphohydrolase [Clostridium arbusti]
MKISLDKTIRAMAIALDLAEISSVKDSTIIEDISNINFSNHNYLNHSKRTTYISLKLGEQLNFSEIFMKELYISSLLHDIGASNFLKESHTSNTFILDHCKNGSRIIENLPLFTNISPIILYHHENFDGSGAMGLKGDEIPIASQIIRLADLVELLYDENFTSHKQRSKIISWVKINSNFIFSENLVNTFLCIAEKDIFWFDIENISFMDFILDNISPSLDIYLDLYEFEKIAYILASIIDNKSSFTAKHSKGIADLACMVSHHMGYPEEKCLEIKIAGLLHDIGKLAIPNSILDKNGQLTKDEFSVIKSHVYYTKIILDRIEDIKDISEWASNHHEKLNATGYPRKLDRFTISEESRILCVCDIYQALTEDRPYRNGLNSERAFAILNGMIDEGLICEHSVKELKDTLKENTY